MLVPEVEVGGAGLYQWDRVGAPVRLWGFLMWTKGRRGSCLMVAPKPHEA